MSQRYERLLSLVSAGDRRAIARVLSFLEAGDPAAFSAVIGAERVGHSLVLGVTGAPGVGKSAAVSRLIECAIHDGLNVAVLAVDPSSIYSGGALLGDRIRMMPTLQNNEDVFMRSLAARSHLGGLNRACRASVRVLELAGYELVIVETVGVGQSEVDIREVADRVAVLLGPKGGDWVQAAKSGLMEIADVIAISKSDLGGAEQTMRDLHAALPFMENGAGKLIIVPFSSHTGDGVREFWTSLTSQESGTDETARKPYRGSGLNSAHALLDSAYALCPDLFFEYEESSDAVLLFGALAKYFRGDVKSPEIAD